MIGWKDAVYAFAIKALDDRALADPSVLPVLEQGLDELDKSAGGTWLSLDEERQLAALESIQTTPFFTLVRSVSVNALYSNELAYQHFGYEGRLLP